MTSEAFIVANHNLNVSNIDTLANDIASRLSLNIEFGHYDFKNDTFLTAGTITINPDAPFFKLFPEDHKNTIEVSFILELGDGHINIYKEIIDLTLPFPLAYDDLYEEHATNPKGLLSDGILNDWLLDLIKLGTDKIYFVKDFNKELSGINHGDEQKYTWDVFTGIIHKHLNHFIEPKKQ